MMANIAVGISVSMINVGLHALVSVALVHWLDRHGLGHRRHRRMTLAIVMGAIGGLLTLTHMAEVALWALVYVLIGAAPASGNDFYFAFVNYTTLGYGDLLPDEGWRLLGPMAAANGVLLFGWSTALIFGALQRAAHRLGLEKGQGAA